MQTKTTSNVTVIDVSHHQNDRGPIDWAKVKGSGVAGAFIKASEGGSSIDVAFAANLLGAQKAGLKVGAYHYAHSELNDPIKEARNFVNRVAGYKFDFPHVLDVEGKAHEIGDSGDLTAWCIVWLQEVEKQTGHPAMIYTGGSFAKSYLGKALGKWPLWVAHYGVDRPMANATWNEWAVFQFTSSGTVPGIVGNVDMNVMEKAFFDKYSGVKPVPRPTKDDTIKVVVNDVLVAYGRLIDNHVYLPIRALGEALGADVNWNAATSTPYINGKPLTKFVLIDGKTYLGIRNATELLGGRVSWDGLTKKVYFYET